MFNLLQITLEKKGEFSAGTISLDGKPFTLRIPKTKEKSGRKGSIFEDFAPNDKFLFPGTNLPPSGVLEFKFGSIHAPPQDTDTLSEGLMAKLRAELLKNQSNINLKQAGFPTRSSCFVV